MSRARPVSDATMKRQSSRIARLISAWFEKHARALPWRTTPRDAYRSLVSEAMLQQTQVSRVVESFEAFIARFPDVQALAEADEQHVLAAWKGLGYYRRAKNLQNAARVIAHQHGGEFPREARDLAKLPGIGRYTSAALSSLVFQERVPLVDGNVERVILRLDGKRLASGSGEAQRWVWARAAALVEASEDAASLNEGLMELGAMVCTPRRPACDRCPVRGACMANAEGTTQDIPSPKVRPDRKRLLCSTVVIEDSRGRLLLEQRGDTGLWAKMWQAPTLEHGHRYQREEELREWLGVAFLERAGALEHLTTHRAVRFRMWRGRLAPGTRPRRGRFFTVREAGEIPMSSAQRAVISAATARSI